MIYKYLKSRWSILIITLIFFFIRLPFLDQLSLIPDERDLALTSYSLAKTGNDLFGNRFPLYFDGISPHSPFISFYYGLIWWLTPLTRTVFNTRLVFLIPASLLPLLVYELILSLTKKKDISLLTSLIFSFNPWIYHISRLGLEVNLALPLLLTAIIFQINNNKFISYIFYGLTFFTYQGFRPLVIILPLYFEVYFHIQNNLNIKRTMFSIGKYLLIFILLFLISLVIEKNIKSRSTYEIVFFNLDRLTTEVNFFRNISSAPFLIRSFFDNKIYTMFYYLFNNFLKGLDFSYLFHTGDYVAEFSNGVIGQFYLVLAPFLPLGFFYLLTQRSYKNYFIAGIIFLGLIPSVINIYSLTFSIRSSFAAIGFSFMIAGGLIYFYQAINKYSKILLTLCLLFFSLILFFQISYFYYHYFYSKPQLHSELFYERERKLSQYLLSRNRGYQVYVPLPYSTFFSYLFFYPLKISDFTMLNIILKNNLTNFEFKNIRITDCKNFDIKTLSKLNNIIVEESCMTLIEKNLQGLNIEKNKNVINYSSYAPYNFNKKVAYYIFNR